MTEHLPLPTPTPDQVRAEFVGLIARDLLGPAGGEEEVITEATVRSRYLLGMLAPANHEPIPNTSESFTAASDPADLGGAVDELDDLAVGGDDGVDGSAEQSIPDIGDTSSFLPSSMGLTVSLDAEATAIQVDVRYGRYVRDLDAEGNRVWQRLPIVATSPLIPLEEGFIDDWKPDTEADRAIRVRGQCRRYGNGWSVTLFLVNDQQEPKELKDAAWIFQPEMTVYAPNGAAVFVARPLPPELTTRDREDRQMEMIYRRDVEFAIGHGVGVHALREEGVWDRAYAVQTSTMPSYEVMPMLPTQLGGLVVDMAVLAETDRGGFTAALASLTDAYELWLNRQAARLDPPEPDLDSYMRDDFETASLTVRRGYRALERIREGIALLDSDSQAAQAFQFANRAMALQRIRTLFAAQRRQKGEADLESLDVPANRSWRPFQLAFILLNLPGLIDPTHPDRSDPDHAVVDLLWFPTGGGKTEAYLGLTAFALAIRRLQGVVGGLSGGAGVTVLMRYTLRLLTLQQFQRAAALIASCEVIRRDDPARWGVEPFRIGLWVGQSSTPNSTDKSSDAILSFRNSGGRYGGPRSGTPAQLTNCPWCGTPINVETHIRVESYKDGVGRTLQFCADPLGECPFSERNSPGEGLPIIVVDEEIYRRLPALLISTVDKFAQMPWKGETQMLFGRVNGYCPRHGYRSPEIEDSDSHPPKGDYPAVKTQAMSHLRPPDLIIQDELHLISGPLGTLVGLYETAIDALSTWQVGGKTIRPKIIASTATIRRAEQQVRSLFVRDLEVFPPPGLDADDNFFSQRAVPQEAADVPGRLYVGICASGTRLKAVLIRTYVAAMSAAQTLYEHYGRAADPYMTLVGYFNSIRELGGMRRVMDDAVQTRLKRMDERGLAVRRIYPNTVEELTSRRSAGSIPTILDGLERVFDPNNPGDRPYDAVLATNMISVGVDVSRLGLMVVAGQPKTTAEYIQATSRVGRRYPGVVLSVYNWSRPRDLSHYERFERYHATFYRQVEALSVTPFAPRALDRGLSGVMVGYLRLGDTNLNSNKSAGNLKRDAAVLKDFLALIQERAGQTGGHGADADQVRYLVNKRVIKWLKEQKREASELVYDTTYRKQDNPMLPLIKSPSRQEWDIFTCLNSLRHVEPAIQLILRDEGMDNDFEVSED